MKIRYLTEALREDVQKKMVFIGGPRQVARPLWLVILPKNISVICI